MEIRKSTALMRSLFGRLNVILIRRVSRRESVFCGMDIRLSFHDAHPIEIFKKVSSDEMW